MSKNEKIMKICYYTIQFIEHLKDRIKLMQLARIVWIIFLLKNCSFPLLIYLNQYNLSKFTFLHSIPKLCLFVSLWKMYMTFVVIIVDAFHHFNIKKNTVIFYKPLHSDCFTLTTLTINRILE